MRGHRLGRTGTREVRGERRCGFRRPPDRRRDHPHLRRAWTRTAIPNSAPWPHRSNARSQSRSPRSGPVPAASELGWFLWPNRVSGSLGSRRLDDVVTVDVRDMLQQGTTEQRHYGAYGERRGDKLAVFGQSFAPPRTCSCWGRSISLRRSPGSASSSAIMPSSVTRASCSPPRHGSLCGRGRRPVATPVHRRDRDRRADRDLRVDTRPEVRRAAAQSRVADARALHRGDGQPPHQRGSAYPAARARHERRGAGPHARPRSGWTSAHAPRKRRPSRSRPSSSRNAGAVRDRRSARPRAASTPNEPRHARIRPGRSLHCRAWLGIP